MLSPALASPPPNLTGLSGNGSNTAIVSNSGPTSRRRGLSYLRSLSSRDSPTTASSADVSRTSPRHFFSRSSSYQDTKNSRDVEGARRRSRSYTRPNEAPALSAVSLVRVASEQGATSSPSETAVRQHTPPTSPGDVAGATAGAQAGTNPDDMTRNNRPSTAVAQPSEDMQTGAAAMTRSVSNGPANNSNSNETSGLPTIRLFPHQEMTRAGRQSLNFTPISRTLPDEDSIIKVGRYSEREGPPIANPSGPSDAPVGFKSKVVSRRHCEFSFVDGQWNVRDVASSSGTFLNHIRLSQPNTASRLYPVKDGDIVQLGIDFRGGEEMIFRCVKIRIECNRSWQKKPNNFNKQRQAQLRGLAKDQPSANANSGECSICLGNVLPCQALFVAPCAHVWHYKCIRPMLEGRNSQYPQFQCPNCRAYADLEADVDVDLEDWAEDSVDADKDADAEPSTSNTHPAESGSTSAPAPDPATAAATSDPSSTALNGSVHTISDAAQSPLQGLNNSRYATPDSQPNQNTTPLHTRRQNQNQNQPSTTDSGTYLSPSNGIPIPARPTEAEIQNNAGNSAHASPNATDHLMSGMGNEGPLTPRNNAGPFVFDGSGGRRQLNMPLRNLDELSDGIE